MNFKKTLAVLLMGSSFLATTFASASATVPLLSVDSTDISLEGYHYHYDETVNSSQFMKSSGKMFGLNGGINGKLFNPAWIGRFEGRLFAGHKINYRSNGSGESESHYSGLETRGLAYYLLNDNGSWLPSVYTGLGYRFLYDHGQGAISTTGASSYDRHSNYLYLPIGFHIEREIYASSRLAFHIEYAQLLWGMQRSMIYEITIENKQRRGYGLRTGADWLVPLKHFDLLTGIFGRYWKIADSKTAEVSWSNGTIDKFREPQNKTHEIGFRIGARF